MTIDELLHEIGDIFINNDLNCSIGLVGSAVTKGKFDDVDFLIITDNVDNIKIQLKKIFNEYTVEECDDAIKIYGYFEKTLSIALYKKEFVKNIVNDYISGKQILPTHRIWCLGYWLPESFVLNLLNIKLIYDKNEEINEIIKSILCNFDYAKNRILDDCISEIEIKRDLLKKCTFQSIEFGMYKNDVILCVVRGLSIVNGNQLISFKKIDEIVNEINNEYLNNFIVNDSLESLDYILNVFKKYTSWSRRLYLGTWQFGGDFKNLTEDEIIEIIQYAKAMGINKFDTAFVYGKGKVEKILGKILEPSDVILSKIPAKVKPSDENLFSLENYYDFQYMINCVQESCDRLNRDSLDICLLHNWVFAWNSQISLLDDLNKIKQLGMVKKIGISLPNNYSGFLSEEVLKKIDVLEIPYNSENRWLSNYISTYQNYGIEIIIRSLFMQGKEDKLKYESILIDADNMDTSMVIGMTTKDQINENIKILKRG